jgi:hypothetical protein
MAMKPGQKGNKCWYKKASFSAVFRKKIKSFPCSVAEMKFKKAKKIVFEELYNLLWGLKLED